MSFPRYPKYKDSGVEWLGEVPEHWEVAALKTAASHNDDVLPEDTPPDYEINYVDIAGVEAGEGISTREPMPFSTAPSRARRKVQHGDVIVSTVRTYLRAIARIVEPESNLVVSTGFAVIRPREALCTGFAGYMLSGNHFIEQVIARSTGVSYPAINARELVAIPVMLPPPTEQTAIAAFLDRETAKIDALIAEQQRLIELLQEKRQAVISHAVTKGLNPDVPMKDSGIEWLGEVPEHWELRKVAHLFRAAKGKYGQMLTKEYLGQNAGDHPVYSGQTENNGVMGTWTEYEFDFGEDGVLFSTTVGAKAMHLSHLFGRFSLSQNCMIIAAVAPKCDMRFFYYHFQPLFAYERAMIPEHMQASFRMDDLYTYRVMMPSTKEQKRISMFLDSETQRFDNLRARAEQAITLLQERRSALISAAVTGQIDVRGLAGSEAA